MTKLKNTTPEGVAGHVHPTFGEDLRNRHISAKLSKSTAV